VIALTRYQIALLLRSHRWIPPLVLYGFTVVGLGAESAPQGGGLGGGLSWSALMLVPTVAWLTRSMLTAEPGAARACVAAGGGPRRAQLAALVASLVVGGILAIGGFGWALANGGVLRNKANTIELGATLSLLAGGLVAALICLLVGSAIGALCNPPMIRQSAAAMLTTTGAVVAALAWNMSPANAAVRTTEAIPPASPVPSVLAVVAAIVLLAATWTVSALVAARRTG
jgi:uncharacterized membrane protein YidH (DUF202 family)